MSNEVNKDDKFGLRSGAKFLEKFPNSCDPSNIFSNDPMLSKVSDETKNILMNSIIKKRKERDNNIKPSITNSDDKSVDSKILHCVPGKLRWKGKLNRSCYNPDVFCNVKHIAIEKNNSSFEDNLQLSSKNKIIFSDVQ